MDRYIAYYRVSTDGQGRSGLGLEAQRATVERFLGGRGIIEHEYVEIETGKGRNALAKRPRLAAAIAKCRKSKTKLLVAKLDRLARDVRFFLELLDSGVSVAFADMPETAGPMGRFLLTTMAAVAELEAGMISERTKAALAAAKARGTRLGNPLIHADAKAFAEAREAVFRAKYLDGIDLAAEIEAVREAGATGYRDIAERTTPWARNGFWAAHAVCAAGTARTSTSAATPGGTLTTRMRAAASSVPNAGGSFTQASPRPSGTETVPVADLTDRVTADRRSSTSAEKPQTAGSMVLRPDDGGTESSLAKIAISSAVQSPDILSM